MTNSIHDRYEQAQAFMQATCNSTIVRNDAVLPHWIEDSSCFWYVRSTETGREFRIVDAAKATNELAFDHDEIARQLAELAGQEVDSANLPIRSLGFSLQSQSVSFKAFGRSWRFGSGKLEANESTSVASDLFFQGKALCTIMDNLEVPVALKSPDGTKAVFVRDFNLWLRELVTNEERALTTDGEAGSGYGRAQGGWDTSVQAVWSPDSKKVLVVKLDEGEQTERPMVFYAPADGSINPQVMRSKLPYPGDESAIMMSLHSIDVDSGECRPVGSDMHLILKNLGFYGYVTEGMTWWSSDSNNIYYLDAPRLMDALCVQDYDLSKDATDALIEETSDTWVSPSSSAYDPTSTIALAESDELIWYSERSGYGQLYLYDLNSGQLKHRITNVGGSVRGILHFDPSSRELLVHIAGYDQQTNPYYRQIWKINIDTGAGVPIVDGNFDHEVHFPAGLLVTGLLEKNFSLVVDGNVEGVSPDGNYIVASRSRVDIAPESILYDSDGNEIMMIEAADVSNLPDDWVWPEPIMLKAADGETDIYGVVFRPPGFDPDESYPVLDYAWSMPNVCAVPIGSFHLDPMIGYTYLLASALASLGFVVVLIEGPGGCGRGVEYRDRYFLDLSGSKVIQDHVAGIEQLAEKYSYMDLERVGIVAAEQSALAVFGAFHRPDFFKVAVQHPFPDPRYFDLGGNRAMARSQSPGIEEFAGNLDGKLLLMQGMQSTAAGAVFKLIEALRKANKDFDLVSNPNMTHQMIAYTHRREWDFVVRHLQGIEPPKEFPLKIAEDIIDDVPFNIEDKAGVLEAFGATRDE